LDKSRGKIAEKFIVAVVEGRNQNIQTGKEGLILGQKMLLLINILNDLSF
jgi:hypothetical protein